jgi:hypothetical protein
MDVQSSSGIFTLYTTATSGKYEIHNEIPAQTLHLKNVRVAFAADTDAVTAEMLYFDASFLNSNLLVDGLANLYLLPIPLQNNKVTQYSVDLPVQMSIPIRESFDYRIVTSSGVAPSNFTSITLQFEFSRSVL